VIIIDDQNFEVQVLQCDKVVLVEFCKKWNGTCYINGQILKKVAMKFADQVKVCALDIEENRLTPAAFGIRQIPTVVIFDRGVVIDHLVGLFPESTLELKIQTVINHR